MANETRRRRRWPYVLLGVVVVLGGAIWLALARLDAMILARAQSEADTYGRKLSRKIQIGKISTTLLTGAGVRVERVEVGPSPSEDTPMVQLERAEVKVALWPALMSRGKDVPVRSAEIAGLRLNVVRRKDGTTNLEEVARLLSPEAQAGPEAPPEAPEEKERDLSAVRVDHAALTGEIHFLDRSGAQARELAIRQIDLRVDDLRANKSLEVVLKAAVLAPAQNLVVKLTTAPLPPTLVPTPERLAIALQPVDLTPLAPFLPESVGLKGGTLDADLQAQLGGAVPGGKGPTRLVGTAHGRGLRLEGAEGGAAADAALEADITGDTERGDLKLDRLHVALGPAELNGQGEVRGLLTDRPEVKGLTVTGKNLDPEKVAPYYPPLRKQLQGMSGPLGLSLTASGTSAQQALALSLDFTPMRLAIPDQLAKAAGAPMKLDATLSSAAGGGGALRFDTRVDLSGADLRPGGQLNKAPGQQAEIALTGTYHPARGKSGATKVELSSVLVRMLGDAITGNARLETSGSGKAQRTLVNATFKSARLNADALLLASDDSAANVGKMEKGKEKGSKAAPPPDPHRYDGMKGEFDLQIAALRYKETDFQNVTLHALLEGDRLTVQRFKAGVHGGEVALDGTQVKLGPADRPFKLKVKATGLNMAALLPRSASSLVTGRFSGDVALDGAGTDREVLSKNLTGLIQGLVAEGSFNGADLISEVAGPLAKVLPFGAVGLKPGQSTSLGKELPFGLEFANGVARLKKPLEIAQERGALKVDGGIALDGKLDLAGVIALAPATVEALTKGKVKLNEPLPVGFKLTGPATHPQVTAVDLKGAAQLLIKQAAVGGLEKLVGGKLGEKLKQEGLGGGSPVNPGEERAKVEAAAQKEAEDAKRRLQDQAKEKLKGLFGR